LIPNNNDDDKDHNNNNNELENVDRENNNNNSSNNDNVWYKKHKKISLIGFVMFMVLAIAVSITVPLVVMAKKPNNNTNTMNHSQSQNNNAVPFQPSESPPTPSPRIQQQQPSPSPSSSPSLSTSQMPSRIPSASPSKTQSESPSAPIPSAMPSRHNYEKIGEIYGSKGNDLAGLSVSLSSDGRVVAFGAPKNDGPEEKNVNAGHVRIYYLNSEEEKWVPMGNEIHGEAAYDYSGGSVSLSANGKIVALGARLNDAHTNDGVKKINTGHVRVYIFYLNQWAQMGKDIDGEQVNDWSSHGISLSADGTIVAVGAQFNDGNGIDSGHVRVYFFQTNDWVHMGQDLNGESEGDWFGYSVQLSSNGQILVVGAIFNDGKDGQFYDSGHVRIYSYNTETKLWTQIGQDINGLSSGDNFGASITSSSNGKIMAIGAPYHDGNSLTKSGMVQVYSHQTNNNNNNLWVQMGDNIYGQAMDDSFGRSVSISSDGTILAVGASLNDNVNGIDAGKIELLCI